VAACILDGLPPRLASERKGCSMALKSITILTPGGDVSATVKVTPQMTAAEALALVGLDSDFYLRPANRDGFFQADDKLDVYVNDRETLYACPWAQVGLESVFLVSTVLLCLVTGVVTWVVLSKVFQQELSQRPTRRKICKCRGGFVPLWERMGWKRSGDVYMGSYVVGTKWLEGEIFFRSAWDCAFKVLAPKDVITGCGEHRKCFIPQGRNSASGLRWYEVHFNERPRSISSGVIAIQQMLSRAQR